MQIGAEQSRQIAFHIFFGRFFQILFLKTFASLQNCLSLTFYVHHPYLSHNLSVKNTQVTIRLRSSGSTWLYSGFRWLRSSTPNSLNLLSINSIAPYFPFPLFISTFVFKRYEKGFWLMNSLTALFVIFSLMLFLYNEYERGT